jgi:hypothetical protein
MPSFTEKQRRKQVIKDGRLSAEEQAQLAAVFEKKVVLKPEYYELAEEDEMPQRIHKRKNNGEEVERQYTRGTTKMLGDAGEHYAIAKFGFLGIPGAKMPDNWPGYDFVLEIETGLLRVSVKTRSETSKFSRSSWFSVDATSKIDWSVFIINFKSGDIRAWVIPHDKCLEHATPKDKSVRHISWRQLESPDLVQYRENWALNPLMS